MKSILTTLNDRPVTARGPIITDDDRRALREDVAFHDGTVALMTYPSKVVAFFGEEPPRMAFIGEGCYLVKGEAGDFRVMLGPQFEHASGLAPELLV